MVFRQVFKSVQKAFFYTAFTTIALVILPGIPPYTTFKSYKISEPRKLEGPLAPNGILDKATKLIDGGIVGAESIAIVNNLLYTGLEDGRVVRIEDTGKEPKISTVAKLGNACDFQNGNIDKDCARPLGIRVNSAGDIIVADGNKGVLSINPTTGKTVQYFDPSVPIEGNVPGFPDDLDVAKDGTIYWSDLYSPRATVFNTNTLTDKSGRLIKYDPKTKNNTVLLSGLSMANGVQLSPTEDFLLVSETPRGRILRYYLKGPKAGTHDVFLDGLPGMPDNIRSNGQGGFYITLFAPPNQLLLSTGTLPQFRKLIFRLQWIALTTLRIIDSVRIFSGNTLSDMILYVVNFGTYGPPMTPSSPIIVEVDGNGKIINSLHAGKSKKEIIQITQFTRGEKYAYMGSVFTDKIWKIPVSELL